MTTASDPSGGFPLHPHRDMEIFSYVTEGALAHRDSLGNTAQITPGRVQLMSAGTGVRHSEFNPSPTAPTRLLQIWFLPKAPGGAPGYQELDFTNPERANRLKLLADPKGSGGALTIRQERPNFYRDPPKRKIPAPALVRPARRLAATGGRRAHP